MSKRLLVTAAVCLVAPALFADFKYQETTKFTGGAMASMMRVAGVFSKAAREPVQSTVAVKGDRMVRSYADHAEIIDLGAGTFTDVNLKNKTYSVVTFAEMKQAMDQAYAKLSESKDQKVEMNFKVSVNETGQTKSIGGFSTKQAVMKMEMESTDPQSGQKGALVVTSDMWLAPEMAGYQEIQAFQKKMAEKMGFTPGAGLLANNPQFAKGMAGMYQELSKIKGVPVFSTVSMGGKVPPDQQAQGGQAAPPQPQAQPQQQQPQEQRAPASSASSALGSALGGRLGGKLGRFGGLGRKRQKEEDQQPAPEPAPAQQAEQPAAPASSGAPPAAAGTLIEMTMEMTNFESAGVDASLFEVPAGFKKVESERLKRIR